MGEIVVLVAIAVVVFAPLLLRSRKHESSSPPLVDVTPHGGDGPRPRMVPRQLAMAVVAGGGVANVLDAIVHGVFLSTAYYAQLPEVFRHDGFQAWLVLGDFVAVAVFVWVYERVRGSFRPGILGGGIFGLYAGVLIGFPTHVFLYFQIVDFPYAVAWAWTLHQVVWTVTVGLVVGAVAGTTMTAAR